MRLLRLLLGIFPYRYETNRRRIFVSCAGGVRRRKSGDMPKDCDCPRCR